MQDKEVYQHILGLQSPLPRIGIDEKALAKDHSYVSMIYDLDSSTVEAIHEFRDTVAALACFPSFPRNKSTPLRQL
jgi:hypothetical protein